MANDVAKAFLSLSKMKTTGLILTTWMEEMSLQCQGEKTLLNLSDFNIIIFIFNSTFIRSFKD